MSTGCVSVSSAAPRSLLFAPGDDARKLAKALGSGAGLVVIDLEDAVSESAKAGAREAVGRALADRDRSLSRVAVRINQLDGPHAAADLAMAAGAGLDALVVPKARAASLGELPSDLPPLIAIVETAAGLQESDRIARAPNVWSLLLGAVDLGHGLRLEPRADGLQLLFARSKLVLDSAAAGIAPPIDVVNTDPRADEALAHEAALARSLGFGGKACIHPRQLAIVERAFAPSAEQSAWAERVVAAYEAARQDGNGVCVVDGEMVDRPVYQRAVAIVNEARNER